MKRFARSGGQDICVHLCNLWPTFSAFQVRQRLIDGSWTSATTKTKAVQPCGASA